MTESSTYGGILAYIFARDGFVERANWRKLSGFLRMEH